MPDWVVIVGCLALYFILMKWLLPRLGVST
jgi:hypothetical protein